MISDASVLLVEDNEGDIVLTMEALQHAGVNRLEVVRDGQQALEYLDGATTLPQLILLDINLPRIDGLEVLLAIKQSDRYRRIPVIMLTTSSSEKDIETAYQYHANCYIVKNVDLDSFMEVILKLRQFWLGLVTLPSAV